MIKTKVKSKRQIIGNYLVSPFLSVWLAKELSFIDFNVSTQTITSEEAFMLRCIASYENYKRFGNGSYEEFKSRLTNRVIRK